MMKINKEKLNLIAQDLNQEERERETQMRINRGLYKASMRIAMKIKRAMRIRNITQIELSRAMDMDPAMMSRYLSGKFNMELRTMVKFEEQLGITIIDRNISNDAPEEKKQKKVQVMVFKEYRSYSPKNPSTFHKFPISLKGKGYLIGDMPDASVCEPEVTLVSNLKVK